ncbi:hypothetical protein PVAP13_6KG156918 [Panicum virgatum]|uniref:Uncharacterized protein n=1 Tax=Panicum virgatum TaxID=38727 RepID=A0A8T0R9W2_PANVG|nr:hypothetical protein PVAP13_6KG156918 [Panicum virgatum]
MASKMASVSKRKSVVPLKSKATEAAATREAVAAASRVARGSGAAPTCVPSMQPSAGSIRPQSMADGFDSSPLHVKRGYPVGVGAVGSSHGRYVLECAAKTSPARYTHEPVSY